MLQQVHDNIRHKQFYTTQAALLQYFWWPHMQEDLVWFICTCHICQVQQTTKVLIPPVVATPALLFLKIYVNTMHKPALGEFKYIVQGHCSLVQFPEFHMLREEKKVSIVNWLYQDIMCRWGLIQEIVTNNTPVFITAIEYLIN
jgi:Integrase zinc binding domain